MIPLTTIVFLVPPSDATDLCWTTGRAVPGFGSAANNRGVVTSLGVTSRRDDRVIQHKIAATKDAILAPIANLADEANVQLYVLHMSELNATKVNASETLARNRIADNIWIIIRSRVIQLIVIAANNPRLVVRTPRIPNATAVFHGASKKVRAVGYDTQGVHS